MRLLELTHRDFVRRGAMLDGDTKVRVKEINSRISELNTVFGQNLLKESKSLFIIQLHAEGRSCKGTPIVG